MHLIVAILGDTALGSASARLRASQDEVGGTIHKLRKASTTISYNTFCPDFAIFRFGSASISPANVVSLLGGRDSRES
jgi:hypothetical protein